MKQGVILRGRNGNLESLAKEIRHYGAASASLGIKMRDIWDRHIEIELKRIVPLQIPVKHSRPKTRGAVGLPVLIDSPRPLPELRGIAKEIAVVVKILNINFEAALANRLKESFGDPVPPLRHNLKRRLNAERFIDTHQLGTEIPSFFSLDIVSHCYTALTAIWPEPDKWNFVDALSAHRQQQQAFAQILHGRVHRPTRKRNVAPVLDASALNVLA